MSCIDVTELIMGIHVRDLKNSFQWSSATKDNFSAIFSTNYSHLEISDAAKVISVMPINKSKHELNVLIFFSFSLNNKVKQNRKFNEL